MIAVLIAIAIVGVSQVSSQCPAQDEMLYVPIPDKKTGLFEGDIEFTTEQLLSMRHSYNVLPVTSNRRWGDRGATVPYRLSYDYSEWQAQRIRSALATLSRATGGCIRFVEWRGESDYVNVYKGRGCSSNIGRVGGAQRLSLANGCVYTGIIQHEFLHALGFWHEQSRADRNDFIRVKWENIKNYACHNFRRTSWSYTSSHSQPYDYDSVMHYGAYSFTRNRLPTIVPLDSSARIGQRSGPSRIDIAKLKSLYKCP